jgi:EmrB/QacA subfamily drug resistance transporter
LPVSAPAHSASVAPDRLDRGVWLIASVVVVGAIMSILDTTIVNVALETLSRELRAPLDDIQWIATGYLLALATVIPLAGWAAERFGARRVWMTSVVLFVAGSALCGLAQSTEMLIVSRVLQGLGGGMIMPIGMIMLTQAAGPTRLGRVMSVVGVPMLLGPVLGPVLGGLIVDNLSWRWIFYVNVPVGVLGLAMAARLLPRTRGGGHAVLDVLGVALLSPGLALIVFGLSETQSHGGFGATVVWAPIVGGALLVAAFVAHALRHANPLIDLRLFGRREFSAAAVTTFLIGAALFGGMILLPLYFQIVRGEDALHAGLLLAPQGLGAALTMPISGRLTDRIGGGRVVVGGLVLLSVATIPFTRVGPDTPYWLLVGASFVRGFGLSGSMMPAMAAAYAVLERSAVPRATSALNVLQRVGGSLGTAILSVVLQAAIVAAIPAASGDGGIGAIGSLSAAARARVAAPIANAFGTAFTWSLVMTAIAVLPALLLARFSGGAPRSDPAEAAGAAQAGGDGARSDGAGRAGIRPDAGRPDGWPAYAPPTARAGATESNDAGGGHRARGNRAPYGSGAGARRERSGTR